MNKIKDFLEAEKEEYGKLYYEMVDNIYELKDLFGDEITKKRAYVSKVESIKKYLDVIDDANYKAQKDDNKGFVYKFLDVFKSDEKYKIEVLEFKKSIQGDIRFVKTCAQCKCFSCKSECAFESCKNCGLSEIVKACDKCDKCIYHGKKNIDLYHHDFEKDINFMVLGRLVYKGSEYLLLRNTADEDDLQLYRYVVQTNGLEDYESLTDSEIDEIWDIFVDMGVGR